MNNKISKSGKKDQFAGCMTYDEYGRPFIILKEQNNREQISGIDVIKSHILAAKAVTSIMKSSLGPKSLDKVMVSNDGELIVTNDGATILRQMDLDHAIAKLLVELSECQDDNIGDGTTGVVVLAGALLEECEKLIEKGIHPIRIADGFEMAAHICIEHLEKISEQITVDKTRNFLKQIALTSLKSKIVSKCHEKFADIAVEAVLKIADLKNNMIDLERIKIDCKPGGCLEDTILINGVILNEPLSHAHMSKELLKVVVAVVSCGLEIPKPNQIKTYLEMKSVDAFKETTEYENEICERMVKKLKEVGANFVVCQAGIEDSANYLLLCSDINGVRYVTEKEIELIRFATGAGVVPRFESLTAEKLGFAGSVREMNLGIAGSRITVFEDCRNSSVATILIRGGNNLIIEEAKRSLHDALCTIKNLILENKIVYGGGACELSCAIDLSRKADKIRTLEQYAVRAFGDALECIPLILAENCGYSPIHLLTEIKSRQIIEDNPHLGVDCTQEGTCDMKKQQVIETLQSKKQQILLAMQVVKQILKIDEVRAADKDYGKHPGNAVLY